MYVEKFTIALNDDNISFKWVSTNKIKICFLQVCAKYRYLICVRVCAHTHTHTKDN